MSARACCSMRVTAYTNVLANQSLVEAQRANVAFLQETLGITQKRLNAGDVTPTDTAQAEARLSRGLADLNAAEVNLADQPGDLYPGDRQRARLAPPCRNRRPLCCRAAAMTPPALPSASIRR